MKLKSNLSRESLTKKYIALGYDRSQASALLCYATINLDLLPHVNTAMSSQKIFSIGRDITLKREEFLKARGVKIT